MTGFKERLTLTVKKLACIPVTIVSFYVYSIKESNIFLKKDAQLKKLNRC